MLSILRGFLEEDFDAMVEDYLLAGLVPPSFAEVRVASSHMLAAAG